MTTFHFSYDICELHTFGGGGGRGGRGGQGGGQGEGQGGGRGGGRGGQGVKLDEAKTGSRDTFLITYRFNIT